MEITNDCYYIYIIQEREFIRLKEKTYKVGITQDIISCYSEYPKSSKLIYTRICDINFEKEIFKILREKFIQKREYGTEYFEGDYNEIIICINKIIDEHKIINQIKKSPSSTFVHPQIKKQVTAFKTKMRKFKSDDGVSYISDKNSIVYKKDAPTIRVGVLTQDGLYLDEDDYEEFMLFS